MKIMVVGGGGREHAIIKKVKQSPLVDEIFALPGNGGIAADATCVGIGAKDIDGIVGFAVENKIPTGVVTKNVLQADLDTNSERQPHKSKLNSS